MNALRTVITGGTVVSPDGEFRADLVIDEAEIVALLTDATGIDTDETIDGRGLLLLPGMIDTFTPAPWATPTAIDSQRSAAAGGFTTIATTMDLRPANEQSAPSLGLDAAIWYPITSDHLPDADQIARLIETGIAGFTASRRAGDGEPAALTDTELYALMKLLGRANVPLLIRPQQAGLHPRDPVAERLAATIAIRLADDTGTWLHLEGVTLAATMQMVVEARQRGCRISVSVPALNLVLTDSEATRQMRPVAPFRSQDEIDALWPYVLNESVDCISTAKLGLMVQRFGLVTDAQTALPLFWDEAVGRRGMSRPQAARMLATNAAHITGLYPQRGTLRPGSIADLCLVDPLGRWTVHHGDVLDAAHWSPIDGREISGIVIQTIRRGQVIYRADEHTNQDLLQPGQGQLINRR